MIRELTILALGLLIGALSGVWIGGAGRVWRLVFRQWTRGGRL